MYVLCVQYNHYERDDMRLTRILVLSGLILLIITGDAFARENSLDIPESAKIIINTDGNFLIKGVDGTKGVYYSVNTSDRKSIPANNYGISAKPKDGNYQLKVRGSKLDKATIILRVSPARSFLIQKASGSFSFENLNGEILGRIKTGRLSLKDCSGRTDLVVDKGAAEIKNHLSANAPFKLTVKKGNVDFEMGAIKKAGPGIIDLSRGSVHFKMKEKTAIKFHGSVTEGAVTCNVPLAGTFTDAINFTSSNGKAFWEVFIEKGSLKVNIPEPGGSN